MPAEDWCGGDDAAAAALAANQSEVGQSGQGLPYHAAGNAELFLEFLLGRQGGAGVEGELQDLTVQDVPDLGVKRPPLLPVYAGRPLRGLRRSWLHTHADSFDVSCT